MLSPKLSNNRVKLSHDLRSIDASEQLKRRLNGWLFDNLYSSDSTADSVLNVRKADID